MVSRRIRVRHENRGNPTRRQFCKPRRSRAKDREICKRHRLRHIIKIRLHKDVPKSYKIASRVHQARNRIIVLRLAGHMQKLYLRIRCSLRQNADHRAVDRPRAAAAAGNQHRRLFR